MLGFIRTYVQPVIAVLQAASWLTWFWSLSMSGALLLTVAIVMEAAGYGWRTLSTGTQICCFLTASFFCAAGGVALWERTGRRARNRRAWAAITARVEESARASREGVRFDLDRRVAEAREERKARALLVRTLRRAIVVAFEDTEASPSSMDAHHKAKASIGALRIDRESLGPKTLGELFETIRAYEELLTGLVGVRHPGQVDTLKQARDMKETILAKLE